MFLVRIVFCALLPGSSHGAQADALTERGACLVKPIMACGNRHTPRGADGKPIAERAFSGVAEAVYKAMLHRDT